MGQVATCIASMGRNRVDARVEKDIDACAGRPDGHVHGTWRDLPLSRSEGKEDKRLAVLLNVRLLLTEV